MRRMIFCSLLTGFALTLSAAPDAPERAAPLITILQSRLTTEEYLDWATEMGASGVWMTRLAFPKADAAAAAFKNDGITPVYLIGTSTGIGPVKSTDDWVCSYLHTPWAEGTGGAVEIGLLDYYIPGRFELAKFSPPERYVVVQERESGELIPRDAYTMTRNKESVVLNKTVAGRSYRAIFLAADRRMLDPGHHHHGDKDYHFYTTGLMPAGRARQLDYLKRHLEGLPSVEIIRPTSYLHYGVNLETGVGVGEDRRTVPVAHSWYSYWRDMHPALLDAFEAETGIDFDPRWLADSHYGEEGFVPVDGYLKWIEFINRRVVDFVKEYVSLIHGVGKKARWFYGDQHIGLEPYLGDLDETDHDQIVASANNQTPMVRHLMSFPGSQRRILRLPWFKLNYGHESKASDEQEFREFMVQWNVQWRAFKKAMLFKCPDGITVGGNTAAAAKSPVASAEIKKIIGEFNAVYDHCYGKEVFVHPIKMVVLNCWGKRMSWPVSNHYTSQDVFKCMVDWPVEIEWMSFQDLIDTGVPDDATLLYIVGEPETAWGGGRYWRNETLKKKIQEYVHGGGGLLLQGGPTFVDGQFALSELTGISHAGNPTEAAAERLWSHNRWVAAGKDPEAYPADGEAPWREEWLRADKPGEAIMPHKSVTISNTALRGHLDRTEFDVQIDSRIIAADDVEVLGRSDDGSTGIYFRRVGKGRVVYVGGYGYKEWGRVLKALAFKAAGKPELLARLDADNEYVRTVCYPQDNLLIVYNSSDTEQESTIWFDPAVVGVDSKIIRLQDGKHSQKVSSNEIKQGWTVRLQAGEVRFYTISEE